ncbi:MAG TPA: cupredoxin domain-containing protein [Longimicrobiales bacterium]
MDRRGTMLAALVAVVLAGACGDAGTTERPEDEAVEAPGTDALPAAAPDEQQTLPPDDADVQSVDATLAEWSITLSRDSVPAGVIAFNVQNSGSVMHRFEIEGNGEEWETGDLAPGDGVTMSISLSPGEYRVYCPIETDGVSHADQGMSTTLRVY